MESDYQAFNSNSKYLLEQLITARKEINNLRQQIKSLRYVHERDINSVKRLLGLCSSGLASFPEETNLPERAGILSKDSEPSTSKDSRDDPSLTCRPIGVISTWFPNKRGTPRQPTVCGKAPGKLTLFKSIFTNPEHALQGLEDFSHMWILFHFHKNELGHVRAKVAPPRLNGIRTGVFSTRSPHRPCPIGLSLVKIIKVEDCTIYFEGVDMVDQTPVLDIKPYIPHYDNPLHIEKTTRSIDSEEERISTTIGNVDSWVTTDLDEHLLTNSTDSAHIQADRNRISENQSLLHTSPISSSSTLSSVDISRDEELALRLQAEEFQDGINFDGVYPNHDNSNILADNELAAIIESRTNVNPVSYDVVDTESRNDEQYSGSSRFLDGADGPNAICGTDLDLISRRALNLRLDDSSSSSSPIRMGVREAPDGEEGFDVQQPTNAQTTNSIVNCNLNTTRQTTENISDEAVRVPDWISRPNTASLTVLFNERPILQLQEILGEKADEKKRAVENVLQEDPRSVYLRQRYGNQFYTFLIHDLHITCKFDDDRKTVTVFQIRNAGRTCECGLPEWQCTGHTTSSTFSSDQ